MDKTTKQEKEEKCMAFEMALAWGVAWAGGAASAEGGARAAAAARALLVAAKGCARLERRAQLLLDQLRTCPLAFSAGGLFPLDLRFFAGLLATVVGYFTVVLQFRPAAPAASPAPCNASLGE
ncbi:Putative gustatory receptor 98b [Gryllus bimaculatus]|nr:Putative gustatory receptor 98b [Gryllus bimaculatus]